MKTTVPFKKNLTSVLMLLFAMTALVTRAQSQTSANDLSFTNATYIQGTGNPGTVGAVYLFPSVNNNLDARIKISDRSNSQVRLENIDVTSTGFNKAFQPQISYSNGSVSTASEWWMEFEITFVSKNTTTPVSINSFKATSLDIDGDGNRLREWVSFYGLTSYTTENNSLLSITGIVQSILGILTNIGTKVTGALGDYSGIDTTATGLMVTANYNNTSSFKYRIGGRTTGAASNTSRQYSMWFKNFNYSAPVVISLPVELVSFTATLDETQQKANLKWVTASEINVSHFTVEKSYDGKNFNDAATVFAYGNTTEKMTYTFADNVKNAQKQVIYYRLRSNDIDGKSQYSEVRIIRKSNQAETVKMMSYPNPVSNELRVTLPSSWQGKAVVIEVFNQNGQRLKVSNTGSASQTETISVSDLAKGFYLVKASCGAEIAQQKVVKH